MIPYNGHQGENQPILQFVRQLYAFCLLPPALTQESLAGPGVRDTSCVPPNRSGGEMADTYV
jgi:hypothetical protein